MADVSHIFDTDESEPKLLSKQDHTPSHTMEQSSASAFHVDTKEDIALTHDEKSEIVGGDVEIKEDDEGRPLLTRNSTVKVVKREPILWNHVSSAREEALLAFQELDGCVYQSSHLASTGQEEVMSCDCKPDIGPDGENYACGENSDCINRLTSMECTDDECSCGSKCANQRFQLREYANVDVFQAGKKGFGLRAMVDLDKDMFVYEYIGEVINERRFRQRQKEYEEMGEKHFYFMMLQKGEYIDATRKGGFGRFINHSCEPNCYVDKWVVGNKLRMGIFTKKRIVKGEELSFDYNVDRYGGDATPCYCGEPTCIGYIGGKTQTEAANKLPQSVVEALGIDDDDEWDDAKPKNSRRRKKGQDDEEYVNELVPRGIQEKDVPKIMAALLQATERWLLKKLLQRIHNDTDENIQSKIVALHGYQTLGSKIEKWKHDEEISTLILQVLQRWPSLTKNKISSSKIETHIKAFLDDEQVTQSVKDLSAQLLETWSTLEMAYRIPRRAKPLKTEVTAPTAEDKVQDEERPRNESPVKSVPISSLSRGSRGPRNPSYRRDQPWRRPETNRNYSGHSTPLAPRPATNPPSTASSTPVKIDPISQDLQAIIDAATKKQLEQAAALKAQEEKQAAEEAARLAAEAEKRADRARRHEQHKAEKERRAAEKKQHHKDSKHSTSKSSHKQSKPSSIIQGASIIGPSEAAKKYEHILAKFVPNVVAKYQDKLGKEQVKRRAKEIVKTIVAKELKKESPDLSELTDTRKAKIKLYARGFMDKVVARSAKTSATASETNGNGANHAEALVDIASNRDDAEVRESESPDDVSENDISPPQSDLKRSNDGEDNSASPAKQMKLA